MSFRTCMRKEKENWNKDLCHRLPDGDDMELMFPAEYISNVAERMSLYRELDSVQDEAALKQFENNLTDRFGALPEQAQNLLQLVRLRWQAIALGFEKWCSKQSYDWIFSLPPTVPHISSPSLWPHSEYLEHNAFRCQFKQHTDKKAIVFSDIPSIQSAMDVFTSILQKKEGCFDCFSRKSRQNQKG